MSRYFTSAGLLIFGCMAIVAQEQSDSLSIVDYMRNDAANVTIEQPDALGSRLLPNKGEESTTHHYGNAKKMVGYRIQIFSDNNHRTAKNEAATKERSIKSRFPNLPTYLSYHAPAWRLRVGDFKSSEEAREMMVQIKRTFPSFAKEIILVRDRINLD